MNIHNLKVFEVSDLERISAAVFWLPAMTADSVARLRAANSAAQAKSKTAANAGTEGTTSIADRTAHKAPMSTAVSVAEDGSADLAVSVVPEWVEQIFGPRACWLPVICN
jgi:hypothetical protein